MKEYIITQYAGAPDWDAVPVTLIDCFCWKEQYPYQPRSTAQVCLVDNTRLAVRLCSYEESPVSVCRQLDGPVYKDSCIEFFFNPYPQTSDCYLNFECNHAGWLFINYGSETDWHFRHKTTELGLPHPPVTTFCGKDGFGAYWGVSFEIPLDFFLPIYGQGELLSSHRLRGSFFKCGDDTPRPHFGSWQQIQSDKPNFHLPEYFGDLIVE